MPDRQMNSSSFGGMVRTSRAFPATSTMTQAITSTTPVRMAVPRLDSTPEMPSFPKMEVRLANTAEPKAYSSQAPPWEAGAAASCFSIIRKVPAAMPAMPPAPHREIPSPSSTNASTMVSTTLDLSMGTTLLMSPSWSALK